jgi:hypothetical protein
LTVTDAFGASQAIDTAQALQQLKLEAGWREKSQVPVFVCYDREHDEALRERLVEQAKNVDAPFRVVGVSLAGPPSGEWDRETRGLIRAAEQVIVLCGEHTGAAAGVSKEFAIAREEGRPLFLLARPGREPCTTPNAATPSDKLYQWTWTNVKRLVAGSR